MNNIKSVEDQIYTLEKLLQTPEIRKSVLDLGLLLADDFIEFGSSGCIYTKKQVIEALIIEPSEQMTMSDFEVRLLTPYIALVTYKLTKHDCEKIDYSLRSSIWQLHNDGWKMTFHQGTKLEG